MSNEIKHLGFIFPLLSWIVYKFFKILFAFVFFVVVLELSIRASGKFRLYSELNFNTYQSPYDTGGQNHLYVWDKNDSIYSQQTEFAYSYQTNAYGLVDQHLIDTCNTENSIIYLGDSFTFGVGADQDSSIPVILENLLTQTIINAGIPGSDPYFELALFDSIYRPKGFQKAIVMVNFSDLYDYILRGNAGRFKANNKVAYRQAPWIEPIYQYSFIVRAFLHGVLQYDYSLKPPKEIQQLKLEGIQAYAELLAQFSEEQDLVVILQPYPKQFRENNTILKEVLNYTYIDKLDSLLQEKGVQTINLKSPISQHLNASTYLTFSWDLDGHYNAKGYELLANIIANELMLKYPEFIK